MIRPAFRTWFKRIALTIFLLLLLLVAFLAQTWYFRPVSVDLLYLRSVVARGLSMPEMLSRIRPLDNVGLAFYRKQLNDYSAQHKDAEIAQAKRDLADFEAFDRSHLQGQAKISAQVFAYNKKMDIEGERWRWHDFPVNQMFGVQSGLPNFMVNIHQVKSKAEAQDYIVRLQLFNDRLQQVLTGLQKREALGVNPPRFTIEKVLEQMQNFAGSDARKNLLYTSFQEKLDRIPAAELAAEEKAQLLQQAQQAIDTSVLPGYKALIAHYQELLPTVKSNDGVWRLPDGDAYYAYEVRRNTTTDMTPEQVHQIGLAEVARIRQEMDVILAEQGAAGANLGDKIHSLAIRPEQLYPNSDSGKAQMLKDYQAIIDQINAGLSPMFNLRPSTSVVVKPVPAFAEKTAPGAYYEMPSLDGSRPGAFFANMRNISDLPKFGMRTLAYHEAVPGHHFQIALQMKLSDLPLFRRMNNYTAYAEGWALYAERLAWESGFQSKPLDNLGRLQAEMFRAVRLVVDTGMHYKRWSREQAIRYMVDNTGMAEGEVTAEIERYLVSPGQALAYKTGMLKILALREQAKKELGSQFDVRQFHDVVLQNGAMPLGVLETVVQDWILAKKSRPA